MSFLSKVFGGKKEDKAPTTIEAIQKLRETEEMLVKKQEFLEKKIDIEIETAKKNGTKNKRAAIMALKRKNRYAKQLQQIDGTLATIEMQREALEGANTNNAVLQSMKSAADAMKRAHQNMDIEDLHEMMDDIAEQQDISREISEAISTPVAYGTDIDEDELEKELELLQQEELDEELLKTPTPSALPPSTETTKVPVAETSKAKAKPVAKKVEEDDDMRELEMWAS